MIVLDTSVIYALIDSAGTHHRRTADWYADLDDELVTTPLQETWTRKKPLDPFLKKLLPILAK